MLLIRRRVAPILTILAVTVLAVLALSLTVWAGASGSYPKASYNGLSFPSYSLSGAIIDKAWEDDDWTRTLHWNGRLEPGGVLRIAGTAKRDGGSGPGVLNGRLKVTVEVDGSPTASFSKDLIGNDQVVPFDLSVPIGPNATEGRVLVELYGIFGNGQTRNIKLGGVFTNGGPPVQQQPAVQKPPVQIPPLHTPYQQPQANQVETSGAVFTGITGDVEVLPYGSTTWVLAKRENPLNKGDKIKTGEDSQATIGFADMSTFVLREESEIQLTEPNWKDNFRDSKIALVAGNIWVNVKKMVKDGSMEIDMDQAVLGIKGTTFELWETGTRNTSIIKVTEGIVAVRNKTTGQTIDLIAGQTVSVAPTGFINGWRVYSPRESEETVLFFNGNDRGVFNGGRAPRFYLRVGATISYIMTYHWNAGRGAPAGTITLRREEDGITFGPWQATLANGVYWEVRPDILVRPGRYQVIDSDPSTWSQNEGAGHVRIRGFSQ